uniref:Uncharacterized protein n=1 Tax=Arundo donax TaxID=35708 RepID=A0A0A9GWM4_ARUDO
MSCWMPPSVRSSGTLALPSLLIMAASHTPLHWPARWAT